MESREYPEMSGFGTQFDGCLDHQPAAYHSEKQNTLPMSSSEQLHKLYTQCQQQYRVQMEQQQHLVEEYKILLKQSREQHEHQLRIYTSEQYKQREKCLEERIKQLEDELARRRDKLGVAKIGEGLSLCAPFQELNQCHLSFMSDSERLQVISHLVVDHGYNVDKVSAIYPTITSTQVMTYIETCRRQRHTNTSLLSPHITLSGATRHGASDRGLTPALLVINDSSGALSKKEHRLARQLAKASDCGVVVMSHKEVSNLFTSVEDSLRMWTAVKEVMCARRGGACIGYIATLSGLRKLDLEMCVEWILQNKLYTSTQVELLPQLAMSRVDKMAKKENGQQVVSEAGEEADKENTTNACNGPVSNAHSVLTYSSSEGSTSTPESIYLTWSASQDPESADMDVTVVVRTRLSGRKVPKRVLLPLGPGSLATQSYRVALDAVGVRVPNLLKGSTITCCLRPTNGTNPYPWLLHFPPVDISAPASTDTPPD